MKDEDQEVNQEIVNYQFVKESDSTTQPTTLQVEKCSVPSSSVKRQEFYETLLAYCYQRVDINSPEGYATSVMRECRSRAPEASAAMLWAEFNAGEELGSRMVPPGFRLRGVPEQVVVEAISQDYMGKVGTTPAEAARSAASQLRRLPVVAAVATAVKLQLERCIENAKRQVELGVPKERALLNNLPTYAVACNEDSIPQIAAAEVTETIESVDPYALTEENRIAREKAFEAIRSKLPKRLSKQERILAANSTVDAIPVVEEVAIAPQEIQPTSVATLPATAVSNQELLSAAVLVESVEMVEGAIEQPGQPEEAAGIIAEAKAKISAALGKFTRPSKKRAILEANMAEVKDAGTTPVAKLLSSGSELADYLCRIEVTEDDIW